LDFKNSRRTKLGKVIRDKGSFFLYEYDFGDSWEHQLLLEDILERNPDMQYPVYLAGENACPREDSGGVNGYAEKLKIISDPYHEEFHDTKTWLGKGFNPYRFEARAANLRLFRMHL
jgi:hypothetical protein